jgi:hypothetical protein
MSGRAALMNLATRLMRNRTELMFQVVSLICTETGGGRRCGRNMEPRDQRGKYRKFRIAD